MLSVNTEVHLECKVKAQGQTINTLLTQLRVVWSEQCAQSTAQLLEEIQEAHLARVFAGQEEVGCSGCGLIHSGPQELCRRGWRLRRLTTCDGRLVFRLRQLTCRVCGKTFSPYPELLGLEARQRLLPEVMERMISGVLHLSYAKTCALAGEWTGVSCSPKTLHRAVQRRGARLKFTADPEARVFLADGTKCPIGAKKEGMEVRLGVQLQGRSLVRGRPQARLRIVGLGLGERSWARALPAELSPQLVVTDQEPALRAYVRDVYPRARHQLCEWHIVHTLDWSLREDRIGTKRRKRIQASLRQILFSEHGSLWKRRNFARITRSLGNLSPKARQQLQSASDLILYESSSEERTTSLMERQMREINRRIENGARWSENGAKHLLRLRLAKTHNPDDYARVWIPT